MTTVSIPRRALLGSAILAIAAASAGLPRASAEGTKDQDEIKDADKIKKTDALYQDRPKAQQRCEICLQFMPPGKCKIVQGTITPTGWCQYFAARGG